MYVLDDKEKKLLDAYRGKKLRSQIYGLIGFIILGVIAALFIVLVAFFNERWQYILEPPIIEVNGFAVDNPFVSLTITRVFGFLLLSIMGIGQLVSLKKITRLINIIDKMKADEIKDESKS